MKAIIGIDANGRYRPALHFFSRLSFANPTFELVHVDDVLLVGGAGVAPYSYANYPEIDSVRRAQGENLLAEAQAETTAAGIHSTSSYVVGNACETLMEHADESHADLIVVGSTHKSRYGALFLGSVGRGLTIGAHQSVLIAKQHIASTGKLTAVFATDGSDYADDCLRMLVRMKPSGIQRLVVVTAVDTNKDDVLPKEAQDHVDSLVSHLHEEGFVAQGYVIKGTAPEVIDKLMENVNADLLIMGAQGHGFIERLFVGSLSLQEVVATPHSVLLLRNPRS